MLGGDVETTTTTEFASLTNPLPRWWLLTFYATIVFSFGYWFYYHTSQTGDLPMVAYQKNSMKRRRKKTSGWRNRKPPARASRKNSSWR